jgi:hypothetical protein
VFCSNPIIEALKIKADGQYLKQKSQFETDLKIYKKLSSKEDISDSIIVKIPVVVHVIYKNATTNISDAQIKEQIEILNEDFRKKVNTKGFNNNSVGGDMKIEFFLAKIDPKGNSTSGITRTSKNQVFDITNDVSEIAQIIRWDENKYLNIWVTSLESNQLGYGVFPYDSDLEGIESSKARLDAQKNLDGVVVDYRFFGKTSSKNYGFGRTATHEVGHWLGLLHTNADENCGNDFCNDTPEITNLNQASDCKDKFSNCKGNGQLTKNMIENYMDYSPDFCMNIFTIEQVKRVRNVLNLSRTRKNIVSQFSKLPEAEKLMAKVFPNPVSNKFSVQVLLKGIENLSLTLYNFSGNVVKEDSFLKVENIEFDYDSSHLQNGIYFLKIQSSKETTIQKILINH